MFESPDSTEAASRNRATVKRVVECAEADYMRTLNFISLATGMDEEVCGHSVRFWVSGGEMPASMTVPVKTRRHEYGHDWMPTRDEAMAAYRAARPVRTVVVRVQGDRPKESCEAERAAIMAAQKGAEIALAAVAPALRCSKLNPDRGATDDLVHAFTVERRQHATDGEAFNALARWDIETARKTPDRAPWMRLSDAKRHYRRAVHGDPVTHADTAARADALERRYRRAIRGTARSTAKE